jgi:hypothetical protein
MNAPNHPRVWHGPWADAFSIVVGVLALVLAALHISSAGAGAGVAFVVGNGGGFVSLLSLRYGKRQDGTYLTGWRLRAMLFGFFAPLVAAVLVRGVVPLATAKGLALGVLATVSIGMNLFGPSRPLRRS